MAALEFSSSAEIVPCALSREALRKVVDQEVDGAMLPIENSLHGSVAEHYDLLLDLPVQIQFESLLRIRHNLIAAPGVALHQVHRVLSHPVALSQCRRYLSAHPEMQAVPFYDTAGSVKHIMATAARDSAAVAPALAALEYGAQVLVEDIEDHAQNYTRFHWITRGNPETRPAPDSTSLNNNKMTVGFSLEHRPGTLVAALQHLAGAGIDLTRIESRPVVGRPWEYVFYVDLRFSSYPLARAAVNSLGQFCGMVKILGLYPAALQNP